MHNLHFVVQLRRGAQLLDEWVLPVNPLEVSPVQRALSNPESLLVPVDQHTRGTVTGVKHSTITSHLFGMYTDQYTFLTHGMHTVTRWISRSYCPVQN